MEVARQVESLHMSREETNEQRRVARHHGRREIRTCAGSGERSVEFRPLLRSREDQRATAEARLAGSGAGRHAVTIERVRGDPSRHQDHRHARAGVRSAARQVKALDVRTAIGRLEGPQPAPV